MKPQRLLFIDRDGTLIEEPADEQIDSFDKLRFVKGVLRNLSFICNKLDFRLVMVSNQDGLGTDSFPEETGEVRGIPETAPVRDFLDAFHAGGKHFQRGVDKRLAIVLQCCQRDILKMQRGRISDRNNAEILRNPIP